MVAAGTPEWTQFLIWHDLTSSLLNDFFILCILDSDMNNAWGRPSSRRVYPRSGILPTRLSVRLMDMLASYRRVGTYRSYRLVY